ncbi:hypothetical protein QFC22_002804 [Naganishia vaughanmartiniae]|uniref:Uncharacterized protein n=1 Tax=Naganishia vaughanmartiniae TaxID=1424756 RepID=A0ACC2XBZ6_9TREE|nr:hypothetical protein QFC22_002804 [Naganishia vaughanmartiniae]
MSLYDLPSYLQPRIRHITSLRIHRLAVPYDEADVETQQEDATSGGGIEGYDLAVPLPRGSRVRYAATEEKKGVENGVGVRVDDRQGEKQRGLLDDVIHDVLAEESDEGLQTEDGMLHASGTETQSVILFYTTRLRSVIELTLLARSSPQAGAAATSLTFDSGETADGQATIRPLHCPPFHRTAIKARMTTASLLRRREEHAHSAIFQRLPRLLASIPMEPLPLSQDQEETCDAQFDTAVGGGSFSDRNGINGNAGGSPLASPVSPGFFVPLPIPERVASSQSVRSASSVLVDVSNAAISSSNNLKGVHIESRSVPSHNPSMAAHDGNNPKLETHTACDNTNINADADGDLDEKNGAIPYDVPGPFTPDGADKTHTANIKSASVNEESCAASATAAPATMQTRTRSTSISSSRSHLHTYPNLHIPHSGYPTSSVSGGGMGTGGVGVGGHRRERSGTVSSAYHQIVVAAVPGGGEDGDAGRQRQQLLKSYPEESMNGATSSDPLQLQQVGEEVPYVDQRILRNRLVRCFVTFATVKTDEGRSSQQQERNEMESPLARRKFGRDVSVTTTQGRASDTAKQSNEMHTIANALFPFYISPIHIRSTHPTFSGLSPRSDYASWLSVRDGAAQTLVVDVWVELEIPARPAGRKGSQGHSNAGEGERRSGGGFVMTWHKLKGVGGIMDLRRLHEVDGTLTTALPENTLIFTFSTFGNRLFFFELPTQVDRRTARSEADPTPGSKPVAGKEMVNTIMERSLRETKMRKSVGLGELHHMMNLYTVIRDTERDVKRMERDLNAKVAASAQAINEARGCSEQIARCNDLQRSCLDIKTANAERVERTEKRCNALRARRAAMDNVKEKYKLILQVPLPIPQHASEAAPPLSLPSSALPKGVKVDEETISTALGFVALAVNQISHILDRPLTYPLTCAGSKSLVKDTISIIQGPRSFPLYAKGVEKYRYDYGVFLLNKNIELLMVDAGIKLEDMRHTLPNLKMLLLTLAAQDRPRARAT